MRSTNDAPESPKEQPHGWFNGATVQIPPISREVLPQAVTIMVWLTTELAGKFAASLAVTPRSGNVATTPRPEDQGHAF